MLYRLILTIVVAATVLTGSSLRAAPTTAPAPSPEATAAALELLDTMHMEKVLSDSITTMLDLQLKQNPEIQQFRPIMMDFFKKYMSWDALKDDMAGIYASEFTAAELKQMTAFYKTPVGQKMATKLSGLIAKGGEIGQRRVQEHIGELQDAIRAEMAKKK